MRNNRIGMFVKAPADRKRFVVEYNDWLDTAETLTSGTVTGNVDDDDFFIDGFLLSDDKKDIIFYVSGGVSGKSYDATITVVTSLTQTKQDYVTFRVI